MIQFFDEVNTYDINSNLLGSAANPLPAGVQVAFYGGTTVTPATATGITGFITLGGFCTATLQPNQTYTATFSGAQAPNVYGRFTTDSNGNAITPNILPGLPGAPCSVVGYRSPALSSLGYAIEQTNLWPSGWFSPQAMLPGGNAFAVAAGIGNILGALDYMGQAVLALMRLQTSSGAAYALNTQFDGNGSYDSGIGFFDEQYVSDAIDSWAFDFFGGLWVRQSGMSDTQWVGLILAILQTPKCTLVGIQQILTAWSPWFSTAVSTGASPSMGFDQGAGAPSGMDIAIPPAYGATTTYMDTAPGASGLAGRNIVVFDAAQGAFPNSTPGLPPVLESSTIINNYLSTPLVPGQICVYFQNPSNADSGIAPISISNTLLNSIVANWKAGGVNYISGGEVFPCLFAEN